MQSGRQILARLRPQLAAMFEQRAAYSAAAEDKPLAWVFLGPPVSPIGGGFESSASR